MINDKKGASIMVVFMFAVLLFFFAFAIASSFTSAIQSVRTNMACATNFTIMDYGNKATCTITDLYAPLFISLIIGLGGTLVAIKLGV